MDANGKERHVQAGDMVDVVQANHFPSYSNLNRSCSHDGNPTIVGEGDGSALTGEVSVRGEIIAGVPKVMGTAGVKTHGATSSARGKRCGSLR